MRACCFLSCVLLASACARPGTGAPPVVLDADGLQVSERVSPDPVEAALAHRERLAADREQDAQRKPGALLRFFAIKPGMTVLDLYSGGGYNAELVSYIVGPEGEVWAHNNSPYLDFARQGIKARYTPGRLANVRRILAENNELRLPAAKFDAVLMILTYHDIYHVHEASGWTPIDGPALLAELYRGMKVGAVLGVVDHRAAPGSPPETGESLHRIDPQLVIDQLQATGFRLTGESDLLSNPEDDLQRNVFDPAIRGRTDKFVLRFVKP